MKISVLLFLFVPLMSFAQMSGKAAKPGWGGYWWSMKEAETVLGWEDGKGRQKWGPSDVAVFTRCLGEWKRTCDKFAENQGVALSPLMKLDLVVYKKLAEGFGTSVPVPLVSKTAEYELKIHYIDGPDHPHYEASGYAGKCNGWSLSTMDFDEPTKDKLIAGVLFRPADIKAILATLYNGAQFFVPDEWAIGEPVRPNMTQAEYRKARADVLPKDLILALQATIGEKKRGMLADLEPEEGVWNHPVFEYDIKITKEVAGAIEGIVTLTFANDEVGIDDVFSTRPKRVDHLKRDLTFKAKVPASWNKDFNKVISSSWTGKAKKLHPDSLVLGIEENWRKDIMQYRSTEIKNEFNFQMLKKINSGTGRVSSVDLILKTYYQ